jgi:hypothetical protein
MQTLSLDSGSQKLEDASASVAEELFQESPDVTLCDHVNSQDIEKAAHFAEGDVLESPAEFPPLFDHDYCEVVGAVPASVDTAGSAVFDSTHLDQ